MKPNRLLALGVLLAGAAAIAPLTKAQKSTPPQPTEQQKLKERVDALESQLKDAQAKADKLDSNIKAAAIEKDYVERIQKEVNAYYEKAFNTQLATVTIIGLIVGLIGKFGVDHIVQSKLTEASTKLREDFTAELTAELQKLKESNAVQLKQLEDDLNRRMKERVAELENDTTAAVFYSLGIGSAAVGKHTDARDQFRIALEALASNPKFQPETGQQLVIEVFQMVKVASPQRFAEEATKELAHDVYKKLENQLNAAAIQIPELAKVLKERREAPPTAAKS